jgi:hypothetical protein
LSEVPIGVPIPPICDANVIGISTFAGDIPELTAAVVRIGIINTTKGVLFMNALMLATRIRTAPSASIGLADQIRLMTCPTGASAPVATRP